MDTTQKGLKCTSHGQLLRVRRPRYGRPCFSSTLQMGLRKSTVLKALSPLGVNIAIVTGALKGPTLSELLSFGQTAMSVAGATWQAAVAPFAIFGTDRWGLNILFYFTILLMGFNLIVQAPKQ